MELFERYVLESPAVVLVGLFVLTAVAAVVSRAQRSRIAFGVAIGGALAMVAVLLVSGLVQTDSERALKVIEDLRQAALASDAGAFRRHVSRRFASGRMDARTFDAAVEQILARVKLTRLDSTPTRPTIRGDQADVPLTLVADGRATAPFHGHRSEWVLQLTREPDAPHGWRLSRVTYRRPDGTREDLSLSTVLELIR
jgi:hypothetical protein